MIASEEKPWKVDEDTDRLLDDQENRLESLSKILKSFPKSGLYEDENISKSEEYSFEAFIHYVQTSLANSPRTILRHAVNKALFDLYSSKPKIMSELCDLLNIQHNQNCKTSFPDINTFVNKINDFPRGNTYRRLVAAQTRSKEGSPWTIDPIGTRTRMEERIYVSASRRHKPPLTKDEVDEIINTSIEKDKKFHEDLKEKVEGLRLQLDSDDEYLRFLRVSHLWKIAGIQKLWDDYVRADKSEGHERRERGSRFEGAGARLFFQMIVRKLQLSMDECWYVKGANWYDRHQAKINGEIDLAVMKKDSNEVIALCEVKSGFLEIASAFAQHEDKLAKAAPVEAANSNIPQFQIIADIGDGSKTVLLMPKSADVGLFVATILPDESRPVLGAEPALCQAICDGIRNQGYFIRDDTTDSTVLSTNLKTLFKSGLSRVSQQDHSDSADVTTAVETSNSEEDLFKHMNEVQSTTSEVGFDLSVLEGYIRQRVRLEESPSGCLKRCSSNILILKDSDL